MPPTLSSAPLPSALPSGTHVEVRCRYDGQWVDGFDVESTLDDGYRLRRRLDGEVLPAPFSPAEVRVA